MIPVLSVAAKAVAVDSKVNNGLAIDGVAISNAWTPVTPSPMHAGYLTVQNHSNQIKKIIGVEVAFYDSVSVHDVKHTNGLVEMFELEQIELAPASTIVFEPGGKHLMLMGPKSQRKLGDTLDGELLLDNGDRVRFQLKVTSWH